MAEAPLPDDLYTAIGRVAASSAVLEDVLRYVLAEHSSGWLSNGAVVFEGQSLEWLVSNSVAVMTSRIDSPGMEFDSAETVAHTVRLRDAVKSASAIKSDRNTVVHGRWRRECQYESDAECKPRSSEANRSGPVFHVTRSRYRQFGGNEEAWTVSDVAAVATAIDKLVAQIMEAHNIYYVGRFGQSNKWAKPPV